MKGMIIKDLFMIKNNYKSLIVALIIYIFYSFMFDMNMAFFLPFMGLMICISTLNYDEFNNWYTYSTSLPQGRINVVKSKYLITIGIITILFIASFLLSMIIMNIRTNIEYDNSISYYMGEIVAIIFMMSLLFPILFKYGSEKGRLAMIVLGLGVYGLVLLVTKVIPKKPSVELLSFLDKYSIPIFGILSILMLIGSYLISKKIYLKKEF